MKKNLKWMLAAILVCGAGLFMACQNTDLPVNEKLRYVAGYSD